MEALQKSSPTYNKFLVKTKDLPAHFTMSEVEVLFIMLGGEEDKQKKVKTLNVMLIDWIGSKRKGDGGFPSPATINSDLCCFFAATKDFFNWKYSSADFKYDKGDNDFFTKMIINWQKLDVSIYLSLTFTNLIIFSTHLLINTIILHLQLLSSTKLWCQEKNCQLKADDVEKMCLAMFDERIHM